MLAYSPPFPLIIDYDARIRYITAADEEGIMLALSHRDRVQCIYLQLPFSSLQRLITTINDELPALEFLHLGPLVKHDAHLTLPTTFEAPHLRYLELTHFASPIGSPLLSAATGLVRLFLDWIHPSTYPHPNDFLQQIALLPQLESIDFRFLSPVPNHDIERQLLHTPVTIHVTHPNLRVFDFVGVSAFLEAVLPHLEAPLLETFIVRFFNQLRFSVPQLPRFMMTTEKLRFSDVVLIFHRDAVSMYTYPGANSTNFNFCLAVPCPHLDWQISSATQIFKFLSPLLSEVVNLTLNYREHTFSSEWHSQADSMRWRELLGFFENVKTVRVHGGLVEEVSRSLRLDGEPPLEVLPELTEIICPTRSVDDKTFIPLLHEREASGHPINLIGEAFPVGHMHYWINFSTGKTFLDPDPDPLP
jgi:hypothetical protein